MQSNAGTTDVDTAVAGGGLTGLLIAEARSRIFPGETIAIADPDFSVRNDRTWCCWLAGESPIPGIVSHRWNRFEVRLNGRTLSSGTGPYRYEMVQEADFRTHVLGLLKDRKHVNLIQGTLRALDRPRLSLSFQEAGLASIRAQRIFNTAIPVPPYRPAATRLLQHFAGWEVELQTPAFDPSTVTLMDFDVDQQHGFAFMYVLPFSDRRALVELTFFSAAVLPDSVYEQGLARWLLERTGLAPSHYTILRRESGVIPMEDARYRTNPLERVVDLGTIGGFVKPSSGYAFRRTIARVRALERYWAGGPLPELQSAPHYQWFDRLLLRVLHDHASRGPAIFYDLFARRGFEEMFRFLDEEAGPAALGRIMLSVPPLPFLQAIVHRTEPLHPPGL